MAYVKLEREKTNTLGAYVYEFIMYILQWYDDSIVYIYQKYTQASLLLYHKFRCKSKNASRRNQTAQDYNRCAFLNPGRKPRGGHGDVSQPDFGVEARVLFVLLDFYSNLWTVTLVNIVLA